jgi:hypothetical protein
MPPGTSGTWKAYGYVGWYRTVFNNDWCGYPSALVHEIGHNLGEKYLATVSEVSYMDTVIDLTSF